MTEPALLVVDGTELKAVTGIDDHSRFCVAFGLVERATSRPVCAVFVAALQAHGVPEEVLTDIQSGCAALGLSRRPAGSIGAVRHLPVIVA